MKKTYMTPAISVMAIETVLMSNSRVMDCRPSDEPTMSGPTMESENQFSKEHTFDVWED